MASKTEMAFKSTAAFMKFRSIGSSDFARRRLACAARSHQRAPGGNPGGFAEVGLELLAGDERTGHRDQRDDRRDREGHGQS